MSRVAALLPGDAEMDMLDDATNSVEIVEDMARAQAKPLDRERIDKEVALLTQLMREPDAFRVRLAVIKSDKSLTSAEVIQIAAALARGQRPTSRSAAIAAIGQERLRQSHADAKALSAAKAKTW